MASECAMCGRDLNRYGYRTGNTYDGYEALSNLCRECNDRHLRGQGMVAVADRIARQDRGIDLFWTSIKWGLIVLVALAILVSVFGA